MNRLTHEILIKVIHTKSCFMCLPCSICPFWRIGDACFDGDLSLKKDRMDFFKKMLYIPMMIELVEE